MQIPHPIPYTEIPTLRDVYQAKKTIAPHFARTPSHYSAGLSELLEAEVYLKHDEYLPLGAFKGRGGINFIANLSQGERDQGVITASTGNHGQSIASACRIFGVRALIALPENANPLKVSAMRALGAELVFYGANFDEAKAHCESLAKEEGYRYAHPSNEPLLIAGVATQTLEVIEDLPDVEVIMMPLGGGSSAAGACIVAKAVDSNIQVVAVQSEAAPAGYLYWKHGQAVEAPTDTFAEGIATKEGYEVPQSILKEHLADFVLVSCGLNDETSGMFGAAEFARMKPGAYFITIGRGGIHDEDALAAAEQARTVAADAHAVRQLHHRLHFANHLFKK